MQTIRYNWRVQEESLSVSFEMRRNLQVEEDENIFWFGNFSSNKTIVSLLILMKFSPHDYQSVACLNSIFSKQEI